MYYVSKENGRLFVSTRTEKRVNIIYYAKTLTRAIITDLPFCPMPLQQKQFNGGRKP